MSQDFDLQRYKASMARAREAGITFEAIRDIMNDHLGEGDDTDSFGRMVERIRELALQAAERMAAEDLTTEVTEIKWEGNLSTYE